MYETDVKNSTRLVGCYASNSSYNLAMAYCCNCAPYKFVSGETRSDAVTDDEIKENIRIIEIHRFVLNLNRCFKYIVKFADAYIICYM